MADTQRSLDITWDDVRQARVSHWRRLRVALLVLGLLGTLTSVVVLVFTEGPQVQEAAPLPAPPPAWKTAVPQSSDLCATLGRWSSTTMLRLGPETRAYCGRRVPNI